MPPKLSKDAVQKAIDNLSNADKPAESDFKVLLTAGQKGDNELKEMAAAYTPRFATSFSEKLQKEALSVMLDLLESSDANISRRIYQNLEKFYSLDPEKIANAFFTGLGNSDQTISDLSNTTIKKLADTQEGFLPILFEALPKQSDESQAQMVQFIKSNVKFTEENVDKLLEVLEVAFKTCLIDGLELCRKNKKLLDEEKMRPLVDKLLTMLDKSLQSDFLNVSKELLVPLFKFTKTMGNEATTRLLTIITERVLPQFDQLPLNIKEAVMQKVADVENYAESDELLNQIYNRVFLTFPTETSGDVPFSLIEATLFAFIKLARKFNSAASKLIGTTFCYTGQPGEVEEGSNNEEANLKFKRRIEYISSITPDMITFYDNEFRKYKDMQAKTDDEKQDKRNKITFATKAKFTGNNVRQLTRLLLKEDPLLGQLPKSPSWKKPEKTTRNGTKQGNQRNNRGARSASPRSGRFNSNRNTNRSSNKQSSNRNSSRSFSNSSSNFRNSNRSSSTGRSSNSRNGGNRFGRRSSNRN